MEHFFTVWSYYFFEVGTLFHGDGTLCQGIIILLYGMGTLFHGIVILLIVLTFILLYGVGTLFHGDGNTFSRYGHTILRSGNTISLYDHTISR